MSKEHTPWQKLWTIGGEETPWTCGDARVAVEHGEELGHTEILFPITAGDETIAYMPWEPLVGPARQEELRANARLIAEAPAMLETLNYVASAIAEGLPEDADDDDEPIELALTAKGIRDLRTLLARIEGKEGS